MTNEELVRKAKQVAHEERKIQAQVIELLEEINRRLLHYEMGYPSLQAFCEQELGYSPGSAARRIAAMRVVKDVPEAKQLLIQGSLSLETLQMVQIHARKEKLSQVEKREVVRSVTNLSKRQAEKIIQPEKSYQITLTQQEYEKLQELKARLGTSSIETILNEALRIISPRVREPKDSTTRRPTLTQKRELYKSPKCSFPGCNETRHLEVDHRIPWSQGGKTTTDNLQLVCRGHNVIKSLPATRRYLGKG